MLSLLFPLAYYEKRENWPLLLSYCSYFDKSFTEMFVFFRLNNDRLKAFIAVYSVERVWPMGL